MAAEAISPPVIQPETFFGRLEPAKNRIKKAILKPVWPNKASGKGEAPKIIEAIEAIAKKNIGNKNGETVAVTFLRKMNPKVQTVKAAKAAKIINKCLGKVMAS